MLTRRNKAIVDHTSLALCIPITSFPADSFCSEHVTVHCQCRRKPRKLPLPHWDFVTLPEKDRATAVGTKHGKIGKDCACGSGDIVADRQTDRQTHRHSKRRAHHNISPQLPLAR